LSHPHSFCPREMTKQQTPSLVAHQQDEVEVAATSMVTVHAWNLECILDHAKTIIALALFKWTWIARHCFHN
jgi:hypothetical protein